MESILTASFDDEKVFLEKGSLVRGCHIMYAMCNKD